jgi:hypothetical protein
MRDLEQTFREGLAELGAEADAQPAVVRQVVERARSRASSRRRSGLAVGAAAAAVVLIAGLVVVLLGQRSGVEQPAGPTPPSVAPSAPAGYRLEVWRDVSVYVPATWGWGSAPVMGATDAVSLCGGGQVVQMDGSRREESALPYVGRPIPLSDVCVPWAGARPEAPYVWLGAAVRPGTVDLGGGWVRQTIEVGDVTVTVASDDDALRKAILASAHRLSGACEPRLDDPPTPAGATDPDFVPFSLTVCAYLPTSTHLDYDLAYEQELSMGAAKYLVAAVDAAKPLGSHSCYAASGGEWALLRMRGNGGGFRDYVVDMSCPSIADETGTQHVLDSETVTPWAVGGINAVLDKSPLVDAPDRFIPPLP